MQAEQFARIERLIGADGLERLQQAHVVVVGLGAVGSYAVEGLARAGVGRLRLVDFDEVHPSNLNRQLFALHSTIGKSKADIAFSRVKDINPNCEVEAYRTFVHVDTLDEVLDGTPDLVIDAIDSALPKVELLSATMGRGIPVISCMGAALRTDPSCVQVAPLGKTIHCPLAKRVRKMLRKRKVSEDFPCVFSREQLTCLPENARSFEEEGQQEESWRGRPRQTLGSLPTVTGIFGLTAANAALQILLGDRSFVRQSN